MSHHTNILWIAAMPALLLVGVTALAIAGPVTIPNTFTPGTVADANQVNANFLAVKTAVDDNDARINALLADRSVLAAAHVDGTVNPPVVTRFVNRVNGVAPTAADITPTGNWVVDFGFNVSNRFYTACSGDNAAVFVLNETIGVSPRLGNVNAVYVSADDDAGANVNTEFFVVVH